MRFIDHFGLLARHYERLLRPPPVEPWRQVLDLPASGHLLDVGGGTGRVSAPLAGSLDGVIILDVSPGMLRQAASRSGVQAVQGTSEHLPFRDGALSRILMVDALHHVHDADATLRELLRVLAPGGRLVIEEPDWSVPRMKLVAWMEKLALMRSHPVRPERILALARAAGMVVRCEHLNPENHWFTIDRPLAGSPDRRVDQDTAMSMP